MKLIECFVENFGKLHKYKMEFNDGLNILLEENGFGKTTFAAFIEALFYGLDSGRGKDSNRKKYDPWQGGRFGGSVIFSVGDKTYRLERFFGKKEKEDTFKLYNNDTGLESFDYSEKIGLELFGIDRESYEKSAYIPQGMVEAELSGAGDINAKLSDLLESENDLASFDEAVEILKNSKNKYKRTGGIIKNLENCKSFLEETIKNTEEQAKTEAELKEYIAEKRRIKKTIQEKIEKAHSYLQKKEKVAFYESLKKDVEKSIEKIENLKKSVKEIPKKEELEEIKKQNDEYRSALSLSEDKKLSDDEEKKILDIKEKLRGKSISPEEAKEIKNLFIKFYATSDLVASADLKEEERTRLSELEGIFNSSIPTDEELNDIYYEAKKGKEATSKINMIPLIAGSVFILLGVLWSLILRAVFAIPFFLIGIVILIYFGFNFSKAKRTAEKHYKEEKIKEIFEKYGVIYNGDIQKSTRELKVLIEEYSKLTNKKELAKTYRENSELFAIEADIKEKCIYYTEDYIGIKEAEKSLAEFISKSEELSFMENKKTECKKTDEALEKARESLIDSAVRFTDVPFEMAYESLLSVITQLKTEENALEDNKAKLKEFTLKNGVLEKEESEEVSTADLEVLRESREALEEEIISSEKRLLDISEETEKLPELLSDLETLTEEIDEAYKKTSITEKAEKALIKAKESLAIKYLGPLSQNFENYKKLLLAPGDAKLDTELNIGIVEAGEKHSSASYSSGTRDVLGLALRFSVIESIFENEKPVVILDDPFVNLDEARIKEARKTLDKLSEIYQILYFVCHESRK